MVYAFLCFLHFGKGGDLICWFIRVEKYPVGYIIKMKIIFYNSSKSHEAPVLDFIQSLEVKERAKVLGCLKSIEMMGTSSPLVIFRQIRGKLWEIKIQAHKSSYRIFYVLLSRTIIVLLHAYKKKSQKAPEKELCIAEKRFLEVLQNEAYYIN